MNDEKSTKIPKRAFTRFKKAKELLGTPVQICFFNFSDQIFFFKTFECRQHLDLGLDKSSEELISSQDHRQLL